jgi:TRAP-type C4-dicarboxylate transport system permease small subunit
MEKVEESGKQKGAAGAVSSPPAVASPPRGVLNWAAVNFEEIVCAFVLTVLVVSISTAVLFRYVFNSPLAWPDELARYTLVWLTFIGAPLATKSHSHIVVDFAGLFLPERPRLLVALAVHTIVIVFLAVFFVYGLLLVQRMWVAVSPALSIRVGYVYLCIPLGTALIMVHMIHELTRTARALRTRGGG